MKRPKLVITPYKNPLFWIKALCSATFHVSAFAALIVPNGVGIFIFMMLIALGFTLLILRDRVFTFEDNTLTISSAIGFYPYTKIIKGYRFDFNEIDCIRLYFTDGRYRGTSFLVQPVMANLTKEEIVNNLEQNLKERQRKMKTFHIDNITKSKTDELADKIAAWGIKTVTDK